MKLIVKIENDVVPVEIEKKGETFYLKIRERDYQIDAARATNQIYSLIINGSVYEVLVSRNEGHWHVQIGGERFTIDIEDPKRRRSFRADEEMETGKKAITAQMPGRVVSVLVSPGQEVKYDQGLVVLEAMKMQNEIKSPKSGRIAEVAVIAGRPVNAGDLLVVVE